MCLYFSTGAYAGQVDGHRILDGSRVFQPLGRLVLWCTPLGTLYNG